jgi:hypothetical protein
MRVQVRILNAFSRQCALGTDEYNKVLVSVEEGEWIDVDGK